MYLTIINDCRDDNAAGRQSTRITSLLGITPTYIGVHTDLEAAGNIIDILDATGGAKGAILVNVAPRHGSAKKWENGTPFGYFRYKDTVILSSVDGLTLSLVKKLGLATEITVLDIPTTVETMIREGALIREVGESISTSQFRSFDFLPRVAAFLLTNSNLPGEHLPMREIEDAPKAVWWIDCFGNCKTTLTKEDLLINGDRAVVTTKAVLPFTPYLRDVADHTPAIIIGSSGLGTKRFAEFVVQGGSAAEVLGITSGDVVV